MLSYPAFLRDAPCLIYRPFHLPQVSTVECHLFEYLISLRKWTKNTGFNSHTYRHAIYKFTWVKAVFMESCWNFARFSDDLRNTLVVRMLDAHRENLKDPTTIWGFFWVFLILAKCCILTVENVFSLLYCHFLIHLQFPFQLSLFSGKEKCLISEENW